MSYSIEELTENNRKQFLQIIISLLDKLTFSNNGIIKISTLEGDDLNWFQNYKPYLIKHSVISPSDSILDWGYHLEATLHINKENLIELKNILEGKLIGQIPAKLIINQNIPTVLVADKQYELETLHPGTPLDIINFIYNNKRLDKAVELITLKTQVGGTSLATSSANLRQLFRKNPLLIGCLKPFAEIGAKSIIIKQQSQLTPEEFKEIQNSTRSSTI